MLFSVVQLKNSNESFVVKTTCCQGMHSACAKMYGNRPTKQRIIYYSPDEFAEQNFSLDIRTDFCALDTACYKGYVINTFSKFDSHRNISIIAP